MTDSISFAQRLAAAVKLKDVAMVRALLAERPSAVQERLPRFSREGYYKHVQACQDQYGPACIRADFSEGLRIGKEFGLDINAEAQGDKEVDFLGFFAARGGTRAILQTLVECGYNLSTTNRDGWTPFVAAASQARFRLTSSGATCALDILEYLASINAPWAAVEADWVQPVPSVCRLFRPGRKAETYDRLLHTVRVGIQSGWDTDGIVHVKGREGLEPRNGLMYAVVHQNEALAHALVGTGANLDLTESCLDKADRNQRAEWSATYAKWLPELRAVVMRRQLPAPSATGVLSTPRTSCVL